MRTPARGTGRPLRQRWLARSALSDVAATERRSEASVRSLRTAARALERDRPPAPPEPNEGVDARDAFVAMRQASALF